MFKLLFDHNLNGICPSRSLHPKYPPMVVNLIDRVKHSFSKDKKLSSALYGILGFYPHNLEFYRAALAHKSQSYRNRAGKPVNNERLEYLGDAILEAVVSDIVYHRYPRKREGFLTSTRSKIVQRSSLNKLSADLGLDRLIKTTAQPGPRSNNIGGNAFEALMGAVYLDRGYHHCQWFIEKRIIGRLLDIDGVANKEVNFKSKLLEWTQKNRILAEYKLEEKADENNGTQLFHSSVVLEGIVAGTGEGHSKKESQQIAAKEALTKLRREPKFLDSIYRAKEKRTAMEADEVCVVPRIDEIEEEIAQEAKPHVSRNAKLAPSRTPKAKKNAAKPAAAEEKGDNKPATGAKRAPKQTANNEATTAPAKQNEQPKRNEGRKEQQNAAQKDMKQGAEPSQKENAPSQKDNAQPQKGNAPSQKETAQNQKETPAAQKEADASQKQQKSAQKSADNAQRNADASQKNGEAAQRNAEAAQRKKNAPSEEYNAPTSAEPYDETQQDTSDADMRQECAPRRRPSRRSRRAAALPPVDGTPRNEAEAEREAIVRQAEEAAYSQE